MTAFLYCIQMGEGGPAKVGTSIDPASRLQSIGSTMPFDLSFRHILEVGDRRVADAWEARIIAAANRYKARGEWVLADSLLDDLFAEVAPAVDALPDFQRDPASGRIISRRTDDEAMANVYRVSLAAQVGIQRAYGANYAGAAEDYERAVIHARLADGYGVEDIEVMDGIAVEVSRAEISRLVRDGSIRAILAGRPEPRQAAQVSA